MEIYKCIFMFLCGVLLLVCSLALFSLGSYIMCDNSKENFDKKIEENKKNGV